MYLCIFVFVYDLFYLAFTFYAHAKVKSFICKYAYALEYAKHMLGIVSPLWGVSKIVVSPFDCLSARAY